MMDAKIVSLLINKLRVDGGTQPREKIDQSLVIDYAEAIDQLPAVLAFYDGQNYWLADGFHRRLAHLVARRKHILVEVRSGSQRDAILHSLGANTAHGLRRSREDARRAVHIILADEEWAKWSNYRIAEICAVSEFLVRTVIRELREEAREREREEEELSTIKSQATVERGEAVYEMETGKIGKKALKTCPQCKGSGKVPA